MALGKGPWLPQPVLVIVVGVLCQRHGGGRLLVLEQVRRVELHRFGLAPCGEGHRFVLSTS